MFCYNCGQQLDGVSRYCPHCGAVQNNTQQIKPVVTKVNVDDTLPKNGNLFITLLFVVFVMLGCIVFLTGYKEKYDYKTSVVYDGYRVYLPYGFGYEIQEENNEKRLVISDDDFRFMFYNDTDDYDSYKYNDFKQTKASLTEHGRTPKYVKEITRNDHSMIIAEFMDNEGDEYPTYLYIYDTGNSDLLFYGYAVTTKNFEEDYVDTLMTILSKVEPA